MTSRAAWRAWLVANHRQSGSVWLVTFRKHVADRHVPYDTVVEEALCFGWVDSLPRALDADRTMLLLSPRKAGSNWSALNKDRVERMIAAGLMTPAGLEKIEAAKRDGSWARLDAVEALVVPDDLAAALAAAVPASGNFAAFPKSVRRGILEWIGNAKRPETRAARVAETARLAAENRRANQFDRGAAAARRERVAGSPSPSK
ncbi:YdeI family protein [Roseomonas sp. CCTCC AB2023176]|uniref:YdeI/OmpD-associated family protein n=1 Tax=Roseomonas sp. CCTCC AB2023176 TaxID=3342640 RepID=UPI0035E202D6